MKSRRLSDLYRFPGFKPSADVFGIFGDPKARVVRLVRKGKKLYVAPAGSQIEVITITEPNESGISRAATRKYSLSSKSGAFGAEPVEK